MDPMQTTVFILMILFHLTNVISGASLGNVKLFNETFDDSEEQHRTVLQNIQKNYADEFGNYEMADIENFLAGFMTPVKKEKKPIYTSKTFFGSDQFFGAHERSKDNSHHQTWDPFRANRVVGSQPSYFDVPDDLFQQYIYSKNNHEASYSKKGDDNTSDIPRGIVLSENKDEFPFSEIISFKEKENEFSRSKDDEASEDQLHEISRVVDGIEDHVDELSHPVDDEAEDGDELSHPVDDEAEDGDELSHPVDDDAEDEVDELSHPVDDDAEDEVDELSHPVDDDAEDEVDELSHSLDDDAEDEVDELSHSLDDDAEDEVDELSHSLDDDAEDEVDELSHSLDDDAEDEMDELSHPVDDDAEEEVDELSHPVDDDAEEEVDELSRPLDDDAEEEVDELSRPLDDDAEDEMDELSHPVDDDAEEEVDELSRPLDDDAEEEVDELSRPLDDDAEEEVDELSRPLDDDAEEEVDELSRPLDDDAEEEVDELSRPLDDDAEEEVDELSRPLDDDAEDEMDELSRPLDDDAEDEMDELSRPLDDDAEDEMDELSRPLDDDTEYEVDELSRPVDAENQGDELSRKVDDGKDQEDELSRPVDVTQGQADELSEPVDDIDVVNEPFHPVDVAENNVDEFSDPLDDAEDEVDELSPPVDDNAEDEVGKRSHPVGEPQGQANEPTHPVVEIQSQVVELATSKEDALNSKDFHIDEGTTEKMFSRLSHSTMAGVDGELVGLDDSTENLDVFIQSVDGDSSKNREDELISEGDDLDSTFFRLDKLSSAKGIEDLRHLNMTNTRNPFENPRNEADILPLNEQNGNESNFGKFPVEHLEKVGSVGDSDSMEFVEKSFQAPITAEDLDRRKFDIDEFQGSGDLSDSFDALTDTKIESKSGRIIDVFPRVNSTAECTTPKGERGHCRSLSQCPLSDPLNNFNLFLQYVCLSRGVLVGICCPDNPVVEISDPTENSTGNPVKEFKQPIDGCGLNTNTRIVGGKVSLPHEWTWMVALLRRNRFFCGGVIINDWYILTAAHCVMGVKVKDLKVRLGEYNFNEKKDHQEDIPVTEIKRHALFVTLTFQHDIALLKLKRRIEYTKFIGSICLPNPKSGNFSNANATVVGWGTEAFGGTASPVLRQVTVPVWDNEECDKTYRLERITNAFMCAGSPENGEDACQGDSGGPLMTLNEEGRWEVIGIVSWGRRCGDPTFPGVYTRVTSYLDWITENAN